MRYKSVLACAVAICAVSLTVSTWAGQAKSNPWGQPTFCDQFPFLCTERSNIQGQQYSGHDEPALLFYSSTPGSGNSFKGLITLPKDPKTKPVQAGTGGTWNFELHPAFWFGMAMCDTQSFPEFNNTTCTPDSDTNIFDNASSSAPDYIGNHPGTAFMEMQFYPPGWVIAPNSTPCSATKWCAAMNIDSLLQSATTGAFNNGPCRTLVNDETVNFAYITTSGKSVVAANPMTGFGNQVVVTKDVFLMNPGDTIEVRMFDTTAGFEVVLADLTNGKSGSMTASTANGFAQIDYQPSSPQCNSTAYAFHPMYSTSGVHTRVPWAAHSYNVAYSDEIGHFELCGDSACSTGDNDGDDAGCFPSTDSSKIKVGACTFNDTDYDGSSYQLDWPGTDSDAATDAKMHAKPIVFSGSFIGTADGVNHQFDSVAFETDMPAIQSCFSSSCPNPPTGAAFYPFFSSASDANSGCVWQEGGASLANSNYIFDGNTFSDSTEYGTSAISLVYPSGGGSVTAFEDFQNPLSSNPCQAALPNLNASLTTIAFKTTKVGKSSAAKTVKLSNSLTNKAGLGLIVSAQLDDTTDFTISKNTCVKNGVPVELLPKKKCTISVKATPGSATTINGNLTVSADSGNSPVIIPLSVTGD